MGIKQSSFHMGNEFNGNGEVRYLKGTQPCIHPPVSQENVQLTPDFGNYLLKVLGSIPVAISPLNINPVLFALLGSMFSVTQVIITKDPVTGNYDFKFKIISPHDFTNGSYPYTFQIMDNQVPAAMGVKNQWVAFGEQWKYLKNGKYLWHCWEMIDGKWYYFHSDEIMASHEWIETNGKWYFVHGDGDMAVNAWIETNDIWYYVGKDGVMYSDVVATIDGERYYFYKTGRLAVLEVIYIPNTGEKYEADGKGVLTPIENHESLEGTYVDVPQNGKLGTVVSYMGYHKIQSKSSDQYKLKKDAEDTGRYSIASPEYYAMIDSRIVIATKKTIGGKLRVSVADYVDVDFKKDDGSICTYECIIGDIKGDDAPNSWGHYDGQGVVEVIYHDYNPPAGYNKNINNPWGKGRVIRITIAGNYYD